MTSKLTSMRNSVSCMELQISGGRYRGTKCTIPESIAQFRPTKTMVREAICSALQMEISGSRVLELCAGSSIFSMELLSRGAISAVSVESDSLRVAYVRAFLKKFPWGASLEAHCDKIETFLKNQRDEKYDIIFFDPPYYTDDLTVLLPEILNRSVGSGVVIFECASDDRFAHNFISQMNILYKNRKYGKSTIFYLRQEL